MSEDINIIEMMDDEGNKLSFEHLLTFEVDEDFFIAFTPIDKFEDFEMGEVLIMKVVDDDENGEVYLPIETEEELEKMWNIFQELYYADEEEFVEEELDEEELDEEVKS